MFRHPIFVPPYAAEKYQPSVSVAPKKYKIFSHWRKLLFLLLALVVILLAQFMMVGTKVDALPVVQGSLLQVIVASGKIISPRRISIAAEVIGRVSSIPVSEGQEVKRGQLLIQLENNDELATRDQALTAIAQAEAKLRQLREVELPLAQRNFNEAQSDLDQVRNQLIRVRQLNAQNFASQSELDTAVRNFAIAESRLGAARLKMETNQPGGSDLALALATLAQARAALALAKVKLDQDGILSPANGVLIQRDVEQGDIAQPGKPLMVLAAQGETQLDIQIDEKNLGKLSLGLLALASADAFPHQQFNAQVFYINPGVDATRGSVQVKLKVDQPPTYLRQDMTVSVNIETARREKTLIAPVVAVHDMSEAPWVLVIRANKAVRQPVQLGLQGDQRVEILDGLKVDELLIPTTLKLIKAGDSVRGHRIEYQ